MQTEPLRVLDLFSGIGGFSLGLQRAGMKTVAFCEIDPFCRAVLAKHWPNVPCFDDIRYLTYERLRRERLTTINVICGGFPCQPYSRAGKQLGKEDHRALWPEYYRLIEDIRPDWVIAENVIGLVGMELDSLLADLEGLGYSWGAFDIPACAIGAPHQRRRIWIVAHSKSKCGDGFKLEFSREFIARTESEFGNSISQSFADDWSQRIQGGFTEALSRFCGISWGKNGRGIAGEGERSYLPEPTIRRSDDGVRNRLHAIGNAVVPQIPEIIGRAIIAATQ